MTASALRIRGLTAFLEGPTGLRRVLDRVSLDVPEGATFALLGESGSGKTMLLHSVLGLHGGLPGVVSGEAEVLGTDVFQGLQAHAALSEGREPCLRKDVAAWNRGLRRNLEGLLGRSVTLVPQDPVTTLPPFYSVGALLEKALRRGEPDLTPPAARKRALEWLGRVHMYSVDEVAGRYAHELSGGMAQRVAIALALAPGPRLVVADEPTTGLDATLRVRILELLGASVERERVTLLLITHDMEAARLLALRVAILCAGRVVETGPAAEVLDPLGARHPYTRFLLEAEGRLRGEVPSRADDDVADDPGEGGCGYRGRCPRPQARCAAQVPESVTVGPDHRVACWELCP